MKYNIGNLNAAGCAVGGRDVPYLNADGEQKTPPVVFTQNVRAVEQVLACRKNDHRQSGRPALGGGPTFAFTVCGFWGVQAAARAKTSAASTICAHLACNPQDGVEKATVKARPR